MKTNIKLIEVGNQIELFKYSRPITIDNHDVKQKSILSISKRSSEYKTRNTFKALTKIRHYIMHNFNDARFFTLTFKDSKTFDNTDLDTCYRLFRYFFKKLRKKYNYNYQYVVVPEFQNRGAVHFHFVSNLPYIDQYDLTKIWSYGFVWVNKVRSGVSSALYLSKYIIKNYQDKRFEHKRRYRKSIGLILPQPEYNKEIITNKVKEYLKNGGKVVLKTSFANSHTGLVKHMVIKKGGEFIDDFNNSG